MGGWGYAGGLAGFTAVLPRPVCLPPGGGGTGAGSLFWSPPRSVAPSVRAAGFAAQSVLPVLG